MTAGETAQHYGEMMTIERLYKTRKEAMQMLGFGRELFDRAIDAGEIPYIKLSEKKRGFLESDLIRYIEERRIKGSEPCPLGKDLMLHTRICSGLCVGRRK